MRKFSPELSALCAYSRLIYERILTRIGPEWTRLEGEQPQLADDIHYAHHLAEWGLVEVRTVPAPRGFFFEFRQLPRD